jgi:hypothetical protein
MPVEVDRHCFSCNKSFRNPSDLARHKIRKTPCLIQDIPDNDTAENRCKFCNKAFATKYTLKKHYSRCKIKNNGIGILFNKIRRDEELGVLKEQNKHTISMNETLLEMVKTQQDEIKELKLLAKHVISTITDITNNTNNSHNNIMKNSNNTITQNIIINSYKDPNTEGLVLSTKDIYECEKISHALIDKIYFNPERPENHSIYLLNKKDKTLLVYIDRWHTLTSEKDRRLLVMELQNIITQKGAKIVNGLYEDDGDKFLKLPTDLAERIKSYNSFENEARMDGKQLLDTALKNKPMVNRPELIT